MMNLKEYFQKKYPKDSEEEIMVRVLDHMKNQFFNTFSSKMSREDNMSTSSQGSIGSNMFEGLVGESQPEEPVLEDFWDAMIQSMSKKRKAPQ
ncbi:hypothetical protein A2U01_0017328 [Trifolium medium]|uniref:Uncharacterized protein n=1 Tax=Trifolium medium TaxID=97028 RepID=A0A392N9Q0_9FABA|nr:hypothetical protein [Trifolium medium]